MAETVAQTAAAMRSGAGHVYRTRHSSSSGRGELREWVARMASAARWCERRTDSGELWEVDLWRPVLAIELERRRCSGCGRLRGRAAIRGALCWGCAPALCDRCGTVHRRAALSCIRGKLLCDGCRCGVCGDRLPDGSGTCSGCVPF